jgi:hypothetical protein
MRPRKQFGKRLIVLVGTGRFELPTPRTPSGFAAFSAIYRYLLRYAAELVFMSLSEYFWRRTFTLVYRQK